MSGRGAGCVAEKSPAGQFDGARLSPRWLSYFWDLADRAARESKDPKTRVGAVIADNRNGFLSSGYNGFPAGCDDGHMATLAHRRAAQSGILHAELNALICADPRRLVGSRLIVTKAPCTHCVAVICQYRVFHGGPVEIYCPEPALDSQWRASTECALQADMLRRADVSLIYLAAPLDKS